LFLVICRLIVILSAQVILPQFILLLFGQLPVPQRRDDGRTRRFR
jgi:hypothetical protein